MILWNQDEALVGRTYLDRKGDQRGLADGRRVNACESISPRNAFVIAVRWLWFGMQARESFACSRFELYSARIDPITLRRAD